MSSQNDFAEAVKELAQKWITSSLVVRVEVTSDGTYNYFVVNVIKRNLT